ncbi:hypothetical protein AAF712_011171 [Marasmius tenuissimus]|uniref:Uncharacterized protein n=1 Tax=Marasmius tenuissimus TaxID=585030 RepID=A0ABR2ZNK1_9AGAR
MFYSEIRAYYRNPTGDFTLPANSGRAGEDKLRSLGWRWYAIQGAEDERETTFRELIRSLDFTGGQEHRFDLRDPKAGGPGIPEWVNNSPYIEEALKLTLAFITPRLQKTFSTHGLKSDYFNGNTYLDVREPGTNSYIRLAVPGGKYVIHYPAGSIIQGFTEDGSKLSGVHAVFQTKREGEIVNIVGAGLDEHPVRRAYVNSLSQTRTKL